MPEAGLWPKTEPRNTDSYAEKALYEALSHSLPPKWVAWHSLRLRDGNNLEGEGDFVVAVPGCGIIVLEVKGGSITVNNGIWYQNGIPLKWTPREQGHRFARLLKKRLQSSGKLCPTYVICTAFPDTYFENPPEQDDIKDLCIGAQHLPWLSQYLVDVAQRYLPVNSSIDDHWINLIHDFWCESWKPSLNLGTYIKLSDEKRVKLEKEQMELLDMIDGNQRLRIKGMAGSGKTLLAVEAAVRFASSGSKVLYLCFTDALSMWLREKLKDHNIDTFTVRRFAMEVLGKAGNPPPAALSPSEWDALPLEAASETAALEVFDHNAFVLDEIQDYDLNEWLFIEELIKDKPAWFFGDDNQAFWSDRKLPQSVMSLPLFTLNRQYRCTRPINELANMYMGSDVEVGLIRKAISDKSINIIEYSDDRKRDATIAHQINKLISEGVRKEEIAVISLRGLTDPGSSAHNEKFGSYDVVKADAPEMRDSIVNDTFLRFKGLERPAIIITDYRRVKNNISTRAYIATTRALSVLRIVGHESVLREDNVLGRFI